MPWKQADVEIHARAVQLALPFSVRQLFESEGWKGGRLIQLENEISRPTADECVNNYIWLKPFVEHFPENVCSGYYAADVFLELDLLLNNKVLKSADPTETKKSLALKEGADMKRLMGGLRYLWRSSSST